MKMIGFSSTSSTRGFALVTSLLVLVVLTSLGLGAYFLTNLNLNIAENTRTSAIAEYTAHEGLDVALIALAKVYRDNADGSWPSLAELQARMPSDAQYDVVGLDMDSAEADGFVRTGQVTVVGFGPRGAQYETGARFEGRLTPIVVPTGTNPLFGIGWVTDSDIRINGNTTFQIPLWAGRNVTGNATRVLAGSGQFAHAGFTSSGANANCSIKDGDDYVQCQAGQQQPNIPTFDFDAQLATLQAEGRACISPNPVPNGSIITLNASHSGKAVCLAENANITIAGTASNVYVLGPETSTVTLAEDFSASSADADTPGVKIATGRLVPQEGMRLTGYNSIFTKQSIDFGDVKKKESQILGVTSSGALTVGTVLATEGNVNFSNKFKGTIDTVIWANGHVCKKGSGGLSFNGTMLVKGIGTTSGSPCTAGIYWNGGGGGLFDSINNGDLPDEDPSASPSYEASGILVLARRP